MENSPEMQLCDIYDVRYTTWYNTTYFFVAVGILFLIFCYVLYRWYKKRTIKHVTISAYDNAMNVFQCLKKGEYESKQVAYTVLIATLKSYFQESYHILLIGKTDEEFLAAISKQATIPSMFVSDLKTIFEGATYIKFAQQEMMEEQFEKSLQLAHKIVREVKMESEKNSKK